MWEWIATLPLTWQITLPIIVMVLLVVISIWGNAAFKWGKKSIGFGHKNKNSCSKCRNIIMLLSLKYKTERDILQESILRDQMNSAEQKVEEAELFLDGTYRQMLIDYRKNDTDINLDLEHQQQILYEEVLSNAFQKILKEIRRSFKENGFQHMGPIEYTQYCKEKTANLIAIGRKYIKARYPYEKMIIPIEERFKLLDINQMETYVFNLFDKAREIINSAEIQTKCLDDKYEEDMKNTEVED